MRNNSFLRSHTIREDTDKVLYNVLDPSPVHVHVPGLAHAARVDIASVYSTYSEW